MRIVAVRGQNLASIAGPFAIEFDKEPMRDCGIFAITGPTGAGKTTILDAICLALYDKLPRMDTAERGIRIGSNAHTDQQINYDDVRGILRHGAASAFAEVEFVGQDRRTYIARWEVRRARNRPGGRLQEEKITLRDLDTKQPIGEHKSDALQEIAKRVGLGFEQFRRSALLAQGDFDAFVRANSKDRAELLERITGTEIYSRLSTAAYQRTKSEEQALGTLEAQIGEYHPLSSEDRAAIEAQVMAGETAAQIAAKTQAEFERAERWYSERDGLVGQLREGSKELEVVTAANQAAEPDRNRLGICRKAFSIRAEIQAAAQARSRREAAQTRLQQATEQHRLAAAAYDAANSAAAIARNDCEQKRAAYDEIGPQLDRAKQLDATIAEKQIQFSKSEAAVQRAVQDCGVAKVALAQAEAQLKARQEQRNSDGAWLKEHSFAEMLALRVDEIVKDLGDYAAALKNLRALTNKAALLTAGANELSAERETSEQKLGKIADQYNNLEVELATASTAIDPQQRGRLESRRDALTLGNSALQSAKGAAEMAATAADAVAQEERERNQQLESVRTAEDEIADATAQIPVMEGQLEEVRRSQKLSEAAESDQAAVFRMKLVRGKPCPVCGSTDHHLAEVDLRLKARAEQDRQRVSEKEKVLAGLNAKRYRAEAQRSAATVASSTAEQKQAEWQRQFDAAHLQWQQARTSLLHQCSRCNLAAPELPSDVPLRRLDSIISFETELQHASKCVATELRILSAGEAEVRSKSAQRDELRTKFDSATQLVAGLKERENKAKREVAALEVTVEEKQNAVGVLRDRIHGVLSTHCQDWEERAQRQGGRFTAWCRQEADGWQACKQRVEIANTELQGLSSVQAASRATLQEKAQAVVSGEKGRDDARAELNATKLEREGVIGGRDHLAVRTEYRRASEDAEKSSGAAEEACRSRAQEHVTAQTNFDHATVELRAEDVESRRAEAACADSLERQGITMAEAEEALGRNEAWIAGEQSRLDQLAASVTIANSTVAERQRALSTHEAAGVPSQAQEDISRALEEIATGIENLNTDLVTQKARLRSDDEARERIALLKLQHEAQTKRTALWARLNELIGSADGAKFRRFAQSLTFDQLIRFANQHLTEFRPRYELQRAPGSDLGLQAVDHDMADEIRAVHSLSGGERFLASLALALGLASMSSNRGIRVESLFIDEGFGSLDGNSLGVAISALERLQASGRRIGIISHVEELKERISVRVEVSPEGGGLSAVRVVTG